MIKLYNTLTREKEELPEGKKLNIFVCGPTVYDDSHIGHARTYIFFDFLVKYLRSQSHEVFYLQNITDIDDRIIKRAAETGISPAELAAKFTQSYFEDMKALEIDSVTEYAPATKFIPEIIGQVERLIEKGFAYKIDGDGWYFDLSKDSDYGKLSGRTVAQAEDGTSRIDDAIGKRNKGDFCLWKFWSGSADEPKWESDSLGTGRPGWHIEDTAISEKFFGPQYDIHGGAMDLKFPHHEAEIAQQESASGLKPFVKLWIHTGFLTVNGEKMSKSLGNFITIKDFLKKYPAEVLRWMTLTHHYRSPFDYSDENAEQAKAALEKIKLILGKLEFWGQKSSGQNHAGTDFITEKIDAILADDMNTPMAIAELFESIGNIQPKIWTITPENVKSFAEYLKTKLSLFGFSFKTPEISPEIQAKAVERELSRGNKDFKQSDALRQEIDALGYVIEDTPVGPFIWPKA